MSDFWRFECVPEDGGTWMVWDTIDQKPASLGGHDLVGHEATRARVACTTLNKIYRNGLDAAAISQKPDGDIMARE